jgi:NitT/TauT family transport system ATP-binding protein
VDFHDGKRATRRILDSLDFDIEDGEFVSVLGGSGVGKSTLLRVLGGLQAVTPDSVVLHRGQSVAGPPDRVVTVFQDYAASLLPWRTVARNVTLGIESAPKQERERRGAEALDMVGLADRRRAYPRQLSGGMQQRLQIARALVMQPSALLMDEPFGALDAMTKANLQDALLEIHRRTEATTVFVTHDIDEAVYLSDRIFVLAGSPAHIALELTVDLPRPRHQVTTKEHPRYLQLRHRAYEAIGVRTARVAS